MIIVRAQLYAQYTLTITALYLNKFFFYSIKIEPIQSFTTHQQKLLYTHFMYIIFDYKKLIKNNNKLINVT